MNKFLISMATAALIFGCTPKSDNPLLGEWNSQFQIPPFEQIEAEHFLPAYKEAIALHKAEIDAIVNSTDDATFENTIEALDNSGKILSRVSSVFSSANGVNSNETLRAIATELSPLTSAHYDDINLNDKLFQRVKSVYEKRESLGLESDQMRLLTETYKDFERAGANLPEDKKSALKVLNSKLSALQLQFGQNLLKETANFTLLIKDKQDLAGLSESQITEAASRAEKSGNAGMWLFGLDNPSVMPFLQNSDNSELREKMLSGYLNRCNNNNADDNKEVIKQLVEYRLKKANLMGYANYADYVLEDRMAKNQEAVYDLLNQLWTPALKVANREAKDIKKIMKAEGENKAFEAADWRYYFQKSMAKKFNLSESELRPYFKLENVRDGIFYVSNQLYGITFHQLDNVSLPHPEAVAFECKDKDGSHLGVIFMDMFARPGAKRGGAWCSGFRSQSYKDGERVAPLVTIVGNFSRPSGDKPALLSIDETETFFHEFGHALASLLKDVKYSGLGGMTRDFVELPSQIMEHWAFEPEVLKVYAKHYETGEVIPLELVQKMVDSGKYGQGFATVEYLAASLLDMDFHILETMPENLDVEAFEAKVLGDRDILSQIPPRYRSSYFNHTFGGGYTAGYYSYIWAEVLDSDAFQAYKERGNIFDKETATKFRTEILERAGEDDAMTLYVNFRGEKPGTDALLEKRGLK